MEREIMDVREAAEYLRITVDTLYRYLGEGSIPAFKLGNRWRFKIAHLRRWTEDRIKAASGDSLKFQ